jgi:hypothetical protein
VRLALVAALIAGCVPDLDQRTSIIDRTQILAVVAEPAEAKPGTVVAYHALVATPDGEAIAPVLDWAYCTQPKPPTEDGAVSTACLDEGGIALAVSASGADATGTLPAMGCTLFGPNPPGPGFRPRDPDPTGGFYQPLRVRGAEAITIGLDRLACELAGAPPDVVRDFRARYHANQNPSGLSLTTDGGAPVDGAHVAAGATIALHAAWPIFAAEPYAWYDPASVSVITRRESLRVSFYATAGRFDADAAGVGEDDPASTVSVDDAWTAPASPGTVTMWTVLRDSRGGAAIARYTIAVE